MAVMCSTRGERITLARRALVGRSADCLVRIDDRRVSAEHAVISWSGKCWNVRDLGSRNGTLLNGERLAPGARRSLPAGARLSFADSEWTIVNEAAPIARAVRLDTGEEVLDDGEGMLVLAESPLVAVVSVGHSWVLEASAAATRAVQDNEEIRVGSARWQLELPPLVGTQTESTEHAPALSLDDVTLRFRVSRDGEHVSVALHGPAMGTVRLPSRSHQQVLLELARARLSDIEQGVPEGETGWLYTDDLFRLLDMDRTRINLELFRARKLFAQHGLERPDSIVERRTDTQQLRIGTARVEVTSE